MKKIKNINELDLTYPKKWNKLNTEEKMIIRRSLGDRNFIDAENEEHSIGIFRKLKLFNK